MAIACKYCILTKGLTGSDVAGLPQNEEELYEHIEAEHHDRSRRCRHGSRRHGPPSTLHDAGALRRS